MYSTVGDNVTENSVTYSTLTWCNVQNCDIIYGNPFLWRQRQVTIQNWLSILFQSGKSVFKKGKANV